MHYWYQHMQTPFLNTRVSTSLAEPFPKIILNLHNQFKNNSTKSISSFLYIHFYNSIVGFHFILQLPLYAYHHVYTINEPYLQWRHKIKTAVIYGWDIYGWDSNAFKYSRLWRKFFDCPITCSRKKIWL